MTVQDTQQGSTTQPQNTQPTAQGTPTTAPSGSAPLGAAPPATGAGEPTADPLPQGMVPGKDGRIQVLSQSAFKRLKEEAREKGRKDALSSFAKDAGFTSVEELQAAIHGWKAGSKPKNPSADDGDSDTGEPKPKTQNQNNNRPDRRSLERWEREKQQFTKEMADLRNRMKHEADQRKELQRALDAKDAEMVLRETAVMTGIKDVDYAIRLLTRALESKSEKELAEFNEAKFFESLRSSHPYLFGEVVKPATTGTGGNGAPTPPKPGEASTQTAQSGQADARSMSREDFLKHIAKRGINPSI